MNTKQVNNAINRLKRKLSNAAQPMHTPTPWRVGDAGHTIFGPPNGKPSPETVATMKDRDNAALIVRAVNSHEALVEAIKEAHHYILDDAMDGNVEANRVLDVLNATLDRKDGAV